MNPTITFEEQQNLFLQQFQYGMFSSITQYIESQNQAIIINPMRDTKDYLDLATSRNTKITHILLTHIPSDYISGHLSLQKQSGAQIILGHQSDQKFNAQKVQDNDIITFGDYQLRVLSTPGHTIESCCFVLEKSSESGKALALFSGNTILLGDSCGPDQTIAQSKEDNTYLSSLLYDSIRNKILPLDDNVIIYPAHYNGFRISSRVTSGLKDTLGNQKKVNWALQECTREQFINCIQEKQIEHPLSYFYISLQNRTITNSDQLDLQFMQSQQQLSPQEVVVLQKNGSIVLDCRTSQQFLNGHIEGSINMTLSTKIELWLGMIYSPYSTTFVLVSEKGQEVEVYTRLARVGYDFAIKGILQGGFDSYAQSGNPISTIPNIDAAQFKSEVFPNHPYSMDVRDESEFKSGHLANSVNIPVNSMHDAFNSNKDLFPRDQPVYVFCNGGGRAPIGCSLLKANGYQNVIHVVGGMAKLKENGVQLTKE